ncbi:MAG: maleylpyruvate isomerase family mycothiol-dependent enzyme [Acidimicrobiales bacterium]
MGASSDETSSDETSSDETGDDALGYAARVAVLRREGEVILGLPVARHLDKMVPTCPDWTVADLAGHLARVYNWAGSIVEGRLEAPPDRGSLPRRPEGASPVDWLEDRRDRLVRALEGAAGDRAPIWNFGPRSANASWWARRQQHETTIHRVDFERALGSALEPVGAEEAADLLDELFEIVRIEEVALDDLEKADGLWIHLHATDLDGAEWTIDTAAKAVTRSHMKGDVAVRAPMWALARWAWGRAGPGEVEVFGDLASAESWRRSVII